MNDWDTHQLENNSYLLGERDEIGISQIMAINNVCLFKQKWPDTNIATWWTC